MTMTIHNLEELKKALTEMEGNGIASCWNSRGDYSLEHAIRSYQEIPEEDREKYSWYECIYGNGGYSRYFVSLRTGEVTFSEFHSYSDKTKKALALGFRLH